MKRRLTMAKGTVLKMDKIWKSKGISTALKVRLLQASVFSIASYASESWALTKREENKLDAFEMWCYRRVLRVSWVDKRTNKWVLQKIGRSLMFRKGIVERKMRFFGHVCRRNGLEKRIIQGMVEKKRKRGRPAIGWTDDLKRWIGNEEEPLTTLASDRDRWKTIVRTTAAQCVPSD